MSNQPLVGLSLYDKVISFWSESKPMELGGYALNRKMIISFLGAAAAAVITYRVYKTLSPRSEENSLRGPKASNPEMGNFGEMGAAGSLHEYLALLTVQYGPIGAFWWGPIRVAYITSLKVLLDERNHKILNAINCRPPFLFDGFKPLITKHSIQYVNGDEFVAKYHSVWLAAYQRNMESKIPVMTQVAGQIVTKWNSQIRECLESSKVFEVDMMTETFEFASKSVVYASFGSNIGDEICKSIVKGYNGAWEEMEKRLVDGIPSDAERDAAFDRNLTMLTNAVRSILQQQAVGMDGGDIDKHSFLRCVSQQKELYDTEEKVLAESITAIVGGNYFSLSLSF